MKIASLFLSDYPKKIYCLFRSLICKVIPRAEASFTSISRESGSQFYEHLKRRIVSSAFETCNVGSRNTCTLRYLCLCESLGFTAENILFYYILSGILLLYIYLYFPSIWREYIIKVFSCHMPCILSNICLQKSII